MSATPSPNPDRFDPENQRALDRVIDDAFGPDGIDGFEADAGTLYSTERPRPLVCALAEEAIAGGWLGTTQWEVAERLTKMRDRAWLSRARYQGRISLALFLRLWNHPDRPKDSPVGEARLAAEMNRSAAIEIGRQVARQLPADWGLVPEFLSELNYELGCTVVDGNSEWPRIFRSGSHDAAVQLIRSACAGNARLVVPPWYTETQRTQAQRRIERLCADGRAAFELLDCLSQRWRGVLVATADLMESIWSREKRQVA